ncbi:hypothetical protein FOZ62_014346, partial [Perkinsus olseni]
VNHLVREGSFTAKTAVSDGTTLRDAAAYFVGRSWGNDDPQTGLADLDRVYEAAAAEEEEEESGRHHHRSSCSTIHHDNKGKNRSITERRGQSHDSALRGVSLSDVAA